MENPTLTKADEVAKKASNFAFKSILSDMIAVVLFYAVSPLRLGSFSIAILILPSIAIIAGFIFLIISCIYFVKAIIRITAWKEKLTKKGELAIAFLVDIFSLIFLVYVVLLILTPPLIN